MEIQVGDYIRTIDGIKRIVKINTGDRKTIFGQYRLDKPYKGSYSIAEKNILKHSKNIIDLIEIGDYVNGEKVIGKGALSCIPQYYDGETKDIVYFDEIKSIVTKEQFASLEYKVGE